MKPLGEKQCYPTILGGGELTPVVVPRSSNSMVYLKITIFKYDCSDYFVTWGKGSSVVTLRDITKTESKMEKLTLNSA